MRAVLALAVYHCTSLFCAALGHPGNCLIWYAHGAPAPMGWWGRLLNWAVMNLPDEPVREGVLIADERALQRLAQLVDATIQRRAA